MVLKVNFSWKLFSVFLLNAAVIIAILLGAASFIVSKDFDNYVREFDRERFKAVDWIMDDGY